MKRKKPVPASAPAAPTEVSASASRSVQPARQTPSPIQRAFPFVFPVLLFLAMTVQTTTMSLVLAAVALVLSVGKEPFARFTSRLSLPVWGFLLFLVVNLAGSLYSNFGAYAFEEFSKLLASGSLALLLLTRGRKEDVRPLLWGLSAVTAVIAILCLDMAVKGPVFTPFAKWMTAWGCDNYTQLASELTDVTRVIGLYNNGNLSGSLFGLAVLVGVYLLYTSANWKLRLLAGISTGIASVGFLTGVSRGAMLSLAAACLVYLVCAGKGNRFPLFVALFFTALTMGIFGGASLVLLTAGSGLGVWMGIPCGVILWLLYEFAGRRLAAILSNHVKVMAAALAVLVCVGAAGVVVVLTSTEPFVFDGDNRFYRSAVVTAGETYTLEGDWDHGDELSVFVSGGTLEQELTGEYDTLYNGALNAAEFTVPDGVSRVYVYIWSAGEAEIRSMRLSDGTEIALKYTYLPDNIAERLQKNLFEDNSFLLRVQYVKDGWALFTQAPLLGHGLGATEGLLTSVQPFFYESLYLHNHLLQILDETGLVGLAGFLALMIGCAWSMVRLLRRGGGLPAAVMLACFVMMNLHGLMELTFSVRMYQCVAFLLLMLMVIAGTQERDGKRGRVVGICGAAVAALWVVAAGYLLGSSLMAQKQVASLSAGEMDPASFMEALKKADEMDRYCDQTYQVNLMGNALQQGGRENMNLAAICAQSLWDTGDYDACYYTAAYYYLPLQNMSKFFASVQRGLVQERSNPDAWNSAFSLFGQAFAALDESHMEDYVAGIVATGAQMDQANEVLLVDVTLNEENAALLNLARSIEEQGLDETAAYLALTALLAQGS